MVLYLDPITTHLSRYMDNLHHFSHRYITPREGGTSSDGSAAEIEAGIRRAVTTLFTLAWMRNLHVRHVGGPSSNSRYLLRSSNRPETPDHAISMSSFLL